MDKSVVPNAQLPGLQTTDRVGKIFICVTCAIKVELLYYSAK
jgi:hypothetical protein